MTTRLSAWTVFARDLVLWPSEPQGLAIHPITGDLWESEHGPQGGDELNLVEPETIMAGL